MRQIVLDTETTGLDWDQGHRVIEIGCIEILNRRKTGESYHCYLNPQRDVDEAAQEVHGLSAQDLADKPLFADVVDEFLDFIGNAELVIHNASFDVGFLDHELHLLGRDASKLSVTNQVLDTLVLARQMHPGQRNSLDALCKRYAVDNSRRDLHGALLDAQLLADVYLVMTGGQGALSLDESGKAGEGKPAAQASKIDRSGLQLVVRRASEDELEAHQGQLDLLENSCPEGALWKRLEA
ncbi:MAG: DNA polymerase III subunit epsilon [Gammaproteobacteria bacterium]